MGLPKATWPRCRAGPYSPHASAAPSAKMTQSIRESPPKTVKVKTQGKGEGVMGKVQAHDQERCKQRLGSESICCGFQLPLTLPLTPYPRPLPLKRES